VRIETDRRQLMRRSECNQRTGAEARNRRDAFLELTVIALIAVEVIIGVLTLMR